MRALFRRRERAFILAWVLIVVMVLMGLGTALMYLCTIEGSSVARDVGALRALNLAEAGVNWGIWQLSIDTDWSGGTFTLDGHDCAVSVEGLGDSWYELKGLGDVNGVACTCSVEVQVEVSEGGSWHPTITDYAIYWAGGGSGMTLDNNVIIYGPVFANGNVTINQNAGVFDGTVTATGAVSGSGTYADVAAGDDDPEPLSMDLSYWEDLIDVASDTGSGGFTWGGNSTKSLDGDTLYIDGDVTLKGNLVLNGPGRIVATGDITVMNNAILYSSIDLIAGGSVSISNNGLVEGQGNTIYGGGGISMTNNAIVNPAWPISLSERGSTFMITPDDEDLTLKNNANIRGIVWGGEVEMRNNAIITGTLYADSFASNKMRNNAHVYYDASVFDDFDPPDGLPSSDEGGETTVTIGYWYEGESEE